MTSEKMNGLITAATISLTDDERTHGTPISPALRANIYNKNAHLSLTESRTGDKVSRRQHQRNRKQSRHRSFLLLLFPALLFFLLLLIGRASKKKMTLCLRKFSRQCVASVPNVSRQRRLLPSRCTRAGSQRRERALQQESWSKK